MVPLKLQKADVEGTVGPEREKRTETALPKRGERTDWITGNWMPEAEVEGVVLASVWDLLEVWE